MPVETSRRLSDPEIHTLLRLYQQTRRAEYRDQIVMQYTNLVESIGRRFAGASMPEIRAIDLTQDPPPRGRWLAPSLVAELESNLLRRAGGSTRHLAS